MSATASGTGGWQPQDFKTQLSPGATIKLTASAQAGYGQCVYFSDSLGSVALNDGTVPGLVSAGVCVQRGGAGPNALEGGEAVTVHQGVGGHQPASTIANDGFTALDFLAVAFDAGNGVPGKLSNYSGSNRPIMGLVFGVDRDLAPYVWTGPVASLMARSLLLLKAKTLGWFAHVVDASAATTTAEKSINREPVHGVITAVKFTTLGTLAADNTDYVGINVYKADGAGGTHVLVASYDSRAANQGAMAAGVPMSFALSAVAGALNLLETDVLSYEVTKGGSGKVVPVGVLSVIGKVI
jgi:hypothetical protein